MRTLYSLDRVASGHSRVQDAVNTVFFVFVQVVGWDVQLCLSVAHWQCGPWAVQVSEVSV